ncbi:hypothetical protein XM38_038330 [Halomicronema hongdechloris C2206]|uniref:Uncharacterized protein n=1 Tax=Halomicronema hongdechloris C2206 TaxID=1641165 RepID=A0A1Z3HRD1_9CYAN|nr:hypothetical protein XM38_038330 [Halomicronema hongdechloris C2206]
MTRTYSQAAQIRTRQVDPLLEQLVAQDTPPELYQSARFVST